MLTEVSELKEALAPVFDRYQVSKAVVFGSVAKGTADDQDHVGNSGNGLHTGWNCNKNIKWSCTVRWNRMIAGRVYHLSSRNFDTVILPRLN